MKGRGTGGLFAIAATFALGATVARIVAARHAARFAVDFAQPLVVVSAWGDYGAVCLAILAATVVCATFALFAVVRDARTVPRFPALPVAAAAGAALAAAGAWPFVFSSDVYAYAAYGAIASHGGDPYVRAAGALHGPLVDAARRQWGGTFPACVYGPASVAIGRFAVATASGAGIAATLSVLRLLACGAFLGSIFALDAALRGLEPRRRFVTLAAFGLNPVALWSVAEGHNDAFVLLAALLGFALVRRGRATAGALAIGLTPLVKATGLVFACAFAFDAYAFAARDARRIFGGLALGLAVAVAFALPPVWPALLALRTAAPAGHAAPAPDALSIVPCVAAALLSLVYGIRRLLARERDGHAWLGIALWLALPNPYPWYALWFLPAVAAAGTGAAAAALYGVTISSLVRYLPDAFGHIDPSGLRVIAAVGALPLVLALAVARPFPFRKTTSP